MLSISMVNQLGIGVLYAKLITNKWFCTRILWKLSQTFVTALTNTPPPASQRARVWGDRCGQFAVLSTAITRNLQIAAPNKCRLKTPKMWWLVRYCLGGSWGVPGYPAPRLQILWQNNICWLPTGHWTLQLATTIHLHHITTTFASNKSCTRTHGQSCTRQLTRYLLYLLYLFIKLF